MSGAVTTIRSGTRDELGGVDIGIANVYERPERPGLVSALLITPDARLIIAAGDHIDLGGRRFALESITPSTAGAFSLRFADVTPAPPDFNAQRGDITIRPIAPRSLAKLLCDHSMNILTQLGGRVEALDWVQSSKDTYTTEWNGGQAGPITSLVWAATVPDDCEARIALDLIHYDPAELHRTEISAFWKVGNTHLHIFGRADGAADMTSLIGDVQTPLAADILKSLELTAV